MCAQDAFFHYLPVNEETMSWGMYVTGAGRVTVASGDKYPPSNHPALYSFDWLRGRTLPEFQLLLITHGAGEFESKATGHVEFDEPTLIFLFPGVWHRYRPCAKVGWTERWFSFNGEMLHRIFELSSFGPKLAVTQAHDWERLAADFDKLIDAIHEYSARHPAVLTFQAMGLIADVVAQRLDDAVAAGTVPKVKPTGFVDDLIVRKAMEIIWTHSHYPMSVGDIARQLPVTRRTLDRRFVEATGRSVLEEINTCRLSRAKRLLAETDQPVKAVAHLAGFSSTERMRVLFVEREGVSPAAYRKRIMQSHPGGRKNSHSEGLESGPG